MQDAAMPMNEQSMGLFTDVVLEYKENDGPWERMKCHKAVLSSKSEYFRALFETEPSDLVCVTSYSIATPPC